MNELSKLTLLDETEVYLRDDAALHKVSKEIEGNPIEITDGADAPLVKCVTEIQGSQDLHGYDKPWVGGAGKNKCDKSTFNRSGTIVYNPLYVGDGDWTMSTDCPVTGGDQEQYRDIFFLPGNVSRGASSSENGVIDTRPVTVTAVDEYVTVASRYNAVRNDPADYNWQIEAGTVATAWDPYSNICPISGYSSVGVNVVGKNLFDKTTYTFTSEKYVSLSTGNIGTNSSYACTESYIPCSNLAGQTITLNHIPSGNQPGMAFYDSNQDYISGGKGNAITVPSNAVSYRFTVPIEYASGNDVQIELGSTASEYVPYNPNSHTYTISLGDTYYSGQIDVVRGVLVADKGKRVLDGTETWDYNGTGYRTARGVIPSNAQNCISNMFVMDNAQVVEIGHAYIGSTNIICYVPNASADNLATWKTYLGTNNLEIVYPLATPIEIPLTPTTIKSLLGYNTMWTDGDNLEVEYITQDYQPLLETTKKQIYEELPFTIKNGKLHAIYNK